MTNPTPCPDRPAALTVSAADLSGREIQQSLEGLAKAVGSIQLNPKLVSGLDRIGRDVQPGFASLLKTTEALGSAFAKSEAMTVLDRIGRDVQPGFASLLKTTEALGSAFAKSEAMTVLDRIGRDVQPGFASLLKTTEALGSAFAKSEAMTVLDRIGRDVQPGFASLFKTTEALGSAFAKSEAMTVLDRIGRDVQPGFASLFKTTEALGAVMRTSTKDIGVAAAQYVPSDLAARSQVSDVVLDEPASMPTPDCDLELSPAETDTSDAAGSLVVLYVLTGMLLATALANPGEFTTQIRFWLALSDVPTSRYPEIRGLMNWLAVYGLLMIFRPRR